VRKLLLLSTAIVLAAGPALAGSRVFDPSPSLCRSVGCSSERITGTTGALGGGGPNPLSALSWTAEFFASQNSCLRLQVVREDADLEAVAVAPDGSIYRNDDGGGSCTLCPLVKINHTIPGWYTVQVGRFNGDGLFSNFTVRWGLYDANNPNCGSPTTAQSLRAAGTPKPEGDGEFGRAYPEGTPAAPE
jgi:hypothetical protein